MKKNGKIDIFETVPVTKAICYLALPTILSQIILVLYNMADTFFIGLTGDDARISALTICMPAFMFLSAISNLFGIGGASEISRAMGRREEYRAKRTADFAIHGCLAVLLLYSLAAWLLKDLFLDLLGGIDPVVHRYASRYLVCTVIIGGVATGMTTLFAHLLRAEGHAKTAGIGVMGGGILNMILDPLFMFVILPEGNEVLGAGIATAVSNLASMIYLIVMIRSRRKFSILDLRIPKGHSDPEIVKAVLYVGMPACVMTLFENISYAVLDRLVAGYGISAQAGIGVAKKVNMLAHCIVRGMTQGVMPLIAYNYASGNHGRMKEVVRKSIRISILLSTVCMIVQLVFSGGLISLFIHSGSESLVTGSRYLRILGLGAPFSAAAYSLISFFQAVGEGFKSFILAILRKGILDIPFMFVFNSMIPVYGAVWATPVTDLICCLIAVWFFILYGRRLKTSEYKSD